ncbi:tor signaling pathway regulator [Niveomyces insectorum RCEF 264]|uniref:Tor signaling pathway regulator n=1 Tax=Niveomyces insectorum RCEF 264 TaxID=1081102 RepID=A0A167VG96_9HYPO|nr:tor signaling pathway regulator [Niveomyces insectorum RCEF 264]
MATRPTDQPLSLKAAYAAAERQREALERGVLPAGATDPAAAAASALAAYEHCAARAAALALFSPNESADDIATAHLPYLLLPFRIAELVQRLPATQPGDQRGGGGGGPFGGFDPAVRRGLLRRARDAYERFLHQLDTTVDADATALAGGGGTDPAARRAAKIANLQAEQALRNRLEAQRQRQAAARAHYRRRRRQAATNNDEDEENGTSDAPRGHDRDNNEGDDDDNDDDDDDDDDSEEARALYLAELAHGAHLAFQGLEGLNREDALLAQAPPPDARRGTATTMGGLGDGRQRQGGVAENGYSDRLDNVGRGAVVGGPLLTAEGKPRQPFTIVGRRADLAKTVFRPGHNLPTMSIDEYLAEERRRGNVIEGGGPNSGQAPEPEDEDDMDKADAETMKARAWDEFTEANPRGAGNTLNRG